MRKINEFKQVIENQADVLEDHEKRIRRLEWAVGFDVEMSVSIDKRTVPVKIDECQLSFLPKGE